jgi:uncharacterized damage-inducible protein DinB
MNQEPTTIDPRTVELLWRYMVDADKEILAAADSVPDEPYFREQGISLGSIHKLLVHCTDARRVWLERLTGATDSNFSDPATVSRDALRVSWAREHQKLLEFAREQTVSSLQIILRFRTRRGDPYEMTRGACMLHVSDHATYHRGQLNSMVKLAGGTASPVMLYTWLLAEGCGRAGWRD